MSSVTTSISVAFDAWLAKLNEANRRGLIQDVFTLARVAESIRQVAQNSSTCDCDEGICFDEQGDFDQAAFDAYWRDAQSSGSSSCQLDELLGTESKAGAK